MNNSRTYYLDFLRILAVIAVVIIHVTGEEWYSVAVETQTWKIMTVYNCLFRWAVPVFMMISGALFLNPSKTLDLKNLFGKYFFRLVTVYLLWSFIHGWIFGARTLRSLIQNTIMGHFHLWYIPMAACMYLLIPILKKITESKQITQYFLVMALVTAVIIPNFFEYAQNSDYNHLVSLGKWIKDLWTDGTYHFTLGYVGYFVAGHYFHTAILKRKHRLLIYFGGICGTISTVCLTIANSVAIGAPNGAFTDNFQLGVVATAIALFVFAKYELSRIKLSAKAGAFVKQISQFTFGVYLVHIIVLKKIIYGIMSVYVVSFGAIIGVPTLALLVLAISLGISGLINKIPIIHKYII